MKPNLKNMMVGVSLYSGPPIYIEVNRFNEAKNTITL